MKAEGKDGIKDKMIRGKKVENRQVYFALFNFILH